MTGHICKALSLRQRQVVRMNARKTARCCDFSKQESLHSLPVVFDSCLVWLYSTMQPMCVKICVHTLNFKIYIVLYIYNVYLIIFDDRLYQHLLQIFNHPALHLHLFPHLPPQKKDASISFRPKGAMKRHPRRIKSMDLQLPGVSTEDSPPWELP